MLWNGGRDFCLHETSDATESMCHRRASDTIFQYHSNYVYAWYITVIEFAHESLLLHVMHSIVLNVCLCDIYAFVNDKCTIYSNISLCICVYTMYILCARFVRK